MPVAVNRVERPSRLVKSIPSYVQRSILTILRIFILYKPLRFFLAVGHLVPGAGRRARPAVSMALLAQATARGTSSR